MIQRLAFGKNTSKPLVLPSGSEGALRAKGEIHYISNENQALKAKKTRKQNNEADDIRVVTCNGKGKHKKKLTREKTKTKSISLAEAKNRIRPKVAPDLRLSMFQRRPGLNLTQMRPLDFVTYPVIEMISSY